MKMHLHHRRTLRRLLCAALMVLSLATTLAPAAAAAKLDVGLSFGGITANLTDTTAASDLDGGLSSGGAIANITDSTAASTSMAVKMDAGLWWIGCYRDVYQALNLQYDKVSAGLVLDYMNFQPNEIWVLNPVSSTSVYFTLAPLSHPGYYIAGQNNDCQLKLSKTSASDPAVQWMAIPDGSQYVLVNRKTGLATDTAHGESATGNPVLNYQRNGYRDAQSWNMIRLSESTTTLTPGTRAYPSNGTYGILSASSTNKCVNDQFASTAGNGTAKIVLDTWNQEANEIYILTNRGNGQYTISPSNAPNICLNCWAAKPNDGNQLTLATWRDGDQCSLWEIYKTGSYYCFRNVKTGLWLNLYMNRTTDETKIIGYHNEGTNAMNWKLEPVSAATSASSSSSVSLAQAQIQARLNQMIDGSYGNNTYKAGTIYTGPYSNEQCKGFAKSVFMTLFGYNIGSTKNNNYQISINTGRTFLVGSLTNLSQKSDSTIRSLFSTARPGDFIQLKREHGGPHSMILLSSNSSGITVYECNVDNRNGIRTATISWNQFRESNDSVSVYTAKDYRLH